MKPNKRMFPILILVAAMTFAGCGSSIGKVVYTTTKTETLLIVQRDQDFQFYSNAIRARRAKFEIDIRRFVLSSLREAEKKDLLTGQGVAYLMQREGELRREFDANEKASIQALADRMRGYEDLANLNKQTLHLLLEQDIAFSNSLQALSLELEGQAKQAAYIMIVQRALDYKKQEDKTPPEEAPEEHEPGEMPVEEAAPPPPTEPVEIPPAAPVAL